MRMTPHVAVAIVLALVGLVIAARGILVSSGEAPIPTRELSVPVELLPEAVTGEAAATSPLFPAYAGSIEQNPFQPPQADGSRPGISANLRLPAPPPPPLTLPALPVLPLAQP